MKIKKGILILACVMMQVLPIQAKETEHIVLMSEELPYIFIAEIQDDTHMQVNMVPKDLILPISCVGKQCSALSSLEIIENKDCIKETLENFYSVDIDETMIVRIDRIAKDLHAPYNETTFNTLEGITDYFASITDKLSLSMILQYQSYLDSSLNLKDYYDFYQMFKDKEVTITYATTNYVTLDNGYLPLDNIFHKVM